MNKHSIVNLKCPCFLFRYPKLDIPSQALFNLHRASALPLDAVVNTTKISKAIEATRHTAPIHYSPNLTGWCIVQCQACILCIVQCQPCILCIVQCQPCILCIVQCQPCIVCIVQCQPCFVCIVQCQPCIVCIVQCQPCIVCIVQCQACILCIVQCQACIVCIVQCQAFSVQHSVKLPFELVNRPCLDLRILSGHKNASC